jgi:arylsulfatase A-like enzyme
MKRNRKIAIGAMLGAALLLPVPLASVGANAQVPQIDQLLRPNVMVIVTDDQREGLKVMDKTRAAFADDGVLYDNAFVTTPLCCPARASIMTGRYVHNHGVMSNGEEDWKDLDHTQTLQAHLHDAGYKTALFGKFLNHWPVTMDPPNFDEWALLPDVTGRLGYYGSDWNVNGSIEKIERYSTRYLSDTTVDFIETQEAADTEPWYVYLATGAAHRSFVAEPKYADAAVPRWSGNAAVFERNKSDKPSYVRNADFTFAEGKTLRKKQFRTLMSVDDMVGRIVSTIESLGEDTLILFTSDSGYMWGEHGLANKQVPYQQSIENVMWLRWPGHATGTTDERIVSNVDIAPTIAAATGITIQTDGHDLMDASWSRDRILLEYFGDDHAPTIPLWASTWTPEGQYIEYYSAAGDLIDREYYDLMADPWQLTNLKSPPDPSWRTRLSADRSCSGPTCP